MRKIKQIISEVIESHLLKYTAFSNFLVLFSIVVVTLPIMQPSNAKEWLMCLAIYTLTYVSSIVVVILAILLIGSITYKVKQKKLNKTK